MTTLATIRQELGKDLHECHVGAIASPEATKFIDTELIDWQGSGDEKIEAGWILVTSGAQAGTVRRVKQYDDETGQVTLSRAWTPPAPADTYELHMLLSPADLERCINAGLTKCYYIEREDITPVAGNTEYDLSAYTWITHPSQVRDVYWRTGSAANQYRYHPLRWLLVTDDAGALTLHINPLTTASGSLLVLEASRPYAALAADDDETDCPLDWLKAAAEFSIYELLARNDPDQDSTRYQQAKAATGVRLLTLSQRYQPRQRIRVGHPNAPYSSWPSDIVR